MKNEKNSAAVSPRGVLPEVPQAKTISARNILTAYASDHGRTQRRRINWYGKINQDFLRLLGAEIVEVRC